MKAYKLLHTLDNPQVKVTVEVIFRVWVIRFDERNIHLSRAFMFIPHCSVRRLRACNISS